MLAAVVLVAADHRVRAIYRTVRFPTPPPTPEVAEAFALRFGTFLFVWLLGCFALGAIATVVNKLDDLEGHPLRDSHQMSREHLGAIFLIGAITFAVFLMGGATLVFFVVTAITKIIGWKHFAPYNFAASLIAMIIVSAVASWLGMAIPFVLRGGVGVWAALGKSLRAADGYQGFLLLLVMQSVLGSYVGSYAIHHAIWAIRPSLFYAWNGWLFVLLSALASAAVQPPLFIGFAVLADERWEKVSNSHQASVPAIPT